MDRCGCKSPEELVLLASSLSISLAKDLGDDDLDLVANLFQAIGQNIALIAAQRSICGDSHKQSGVT